MSRCIIRCVLFTMVLSAIIFAQPANAEENVLVFPAVANKAGVTGFWKTVLVIQPIGCQPPPVPVVGGWCGNPITVQFFPFGLPPMSLLRDNLGYPPSTIHEPPVIRVENILHTLGVTGSGALVITGEVRAFVYTYDDTPWGRIGHYVPAVEALENGTKYSLPYDLARNNVFVLNLGDDDGFEVNGTVEIIDGNTAQQFIDIDFWAGIHPGAVPNPPVVGLGEGEFYMIATAISHRNDATYVPPWPYLE